MVLIAEMETGLIITLTTIVTAIATALSTAVITIMVKYHDLRKTGRVDAISEWKEITDRQEGEIKEERAKITELQRNVTDLVRLHKDCEIENATMKGEVRLLQSTLQRVQIKIGDDLPGQTPGGIVVFDLDGVIKVCSPALTPVLHWLPRDLVGENILSIIREKDKEKIISILDEVKKMGQPPWSERPLNLQAINAEGTEIPVSVTLSSWSTIKGEHLFSATIKKRSTELIINPNQEK